MNVNKLNPIGELIAGGTNQLLQVWSSSLAVVKQPVAPQFPPLAEDMWEAMVAKETSFISGSFRKKEGGGSTWARTSGSLDVQPCSNTSALQTQRQAEFSKQAGLLLHPAIRLNASFELNEITRSELGGKKTN